MKTATILPTLPEISASKGVIPNADTAPIKSLFSEAITDLNSSMKSASELKERHLVGDSSVSLPQVMLASQKAKIDLKFSLAIRDQVSQSYRDIINMPV